MWARVCFRKAPRISGASSRIGSAEKRYSFSLSHSVVPSPWSCRCSRAADHMPSATSSRS